jgi:predicted nucleic acid-binding protein
MLFDSDVLIWVLRGKKEAVDLLHSVPDNNKAISIISYMELLEGVRD